MSTRRDHRSGGSRSATPAEVADSVHDVSDLSELDNFTEELERTLAEAGSGGEACSGADASTMGKGSKVLGRGWSRFFGRVSDGGS